MVKIGEVVCSLELPTHRDVLVQFMENHEPRAGEFVEIRDDKLGKNFIAKITRPHKYSEYYVDRRVIDVTLRSTRDSRMLIPTTGTYRVGVARILGIIDENNVIQFTGDVPEPGAEVHAISENRLKKVLGFKEDGLRIGYLTDYPNIEVRLDADIFVEEHSVTCGVTRWGKSYTNAVIIEELVKKGIAVLIIDPHGEYSSFQVPNDKPEEIRELPPDLKPRAFHTTMFSPPGFSHNGTRELNIRFSDLEPEEIVELLNVTGENQIAVIYEAAKMLEGKSYDVEMFIKAMRLAREKLKISASIESVAARLRVLQSGLGIFGKGTDPRELIREGQISIVNLSGLDIRAQRILVACLLRRLYHERQYGNIPEFAVFIDEAQRFAPHIGEPISKKVINTLVREGLKFGISVHVILQRPTELSEVVRGEAGTKIFHRLIESSEIKYASNVLEVTAPELVDALPRLSRGEVIIVGGCTNYIPIRVKVRPRQSKHIGRRGEMIRRRKLSSAREVKTSEDKTSVDLYSFFA